MNHELLLTFLHLAKLKNFTKTAEQLHLVQSTITSRIQNLEDQLGETLFVRTRKNVELTKAGEAFLPYAEQLLQLQQTAISRLKSLEKFKDTLRIGVVHSLYDAHLQKKILNYLQRHKDIAVKVTVEHSENLIQMLLDNQLDLAYTYFQTKSSQFICEPFYNDRIILVTGIQNSRPSEGMTDDELRKLPLLCAAVLTESFQEWLGTLFPQNHLYPLDINISGNIIPYLKAGLGYSFMMASAARPFLDDGSLVEIKLLESTPPSMQSHVLIRKQSLESHAMNLWRSDFSA